MKIYAFDVDDTLWCSGGPVTYKMLCELDAQGHVLGLCGNWAMAVSSLPAEVIADPDTRAMNRWWADLFAFLGPMAMTKDAFLTQIKAYLVADDYVLVGNDPSRFGGSNDIEAARLAGWRFISERAFAQGER